MLCDETRRLAASFKPESGFSVAHPCWEVGQGSAAGVLSPAYVDAAGIETLRFADADNEVLHGCVGGSAPVAGMRRTCI